MWGKEEIQAVLFLSKTRAARNEVDCRTCVDEGALGLLSQPTDNGRIPLVPPVAALDSTESRLYQLLDVTIKSFASLKFLEGK